jgi:hypothetical protein
MVSKGRIKTVEGLAAGKKKTGKSRECKYVGHGEG